MVNLKHFFLQISLSIILLSISLSSAHNKPGDSIPTQPSTPLNSNPPQPSIPVNSNPPQPSTPVNSNPPQPSTPVNSNPPQPSIPVNKNPPQPSIPVDSNPPQPIAQGPSGEISDSSSANIDYGGSFSKVFAFGDSFTDTGNAYLLGNLKSSFIGSLLSHAFKSLNASQLSGNRQCDGRLVVDFLCDGLNIPYLPPYKQNNANFSHGANFAIAGATSLANDFFNKLNNNNNGLNLMWKGIPSGFQTQLDWFHKFLQDTACQGKSEDECKADMENALFWIGGMGRNDYARSFGSTFNIPRLKEMTLAHISNFLQTLISKGAKYIVVQGLPPVGCCPLELFLTKASDRDQMGCAPAVNALIKAHNDLLQKMLEDFQKQHSQCTIVYADYWNAFKTILENHQKFNFYEPFKTCCGAGGGPLNFKMNAMCGMLGTSACKDPSRYINWDGIHFTEAMHRHLADLFLHKGFCKPSFDHLIKMKLGMKALGLKGLGLKKLLHK